MLSEILNQITSTQDTSNGYYYCPKGPDDQNVTLIHKTHVANYFKDTTITILGFARFIYFIYVLAVSSRSQTRGFCRRPAFLSWLPLLNLIAGLAMALFGALILTDTVQGHGKVICQLAQSDLIYMVMGTYLSAVCHYMFAAEFLATSVALNSTVKGLEIACYDYLSAKVASRYCRTRSA